MEAEYWKTVLEHGNKVEEFVDRIFEECKKEGFTYGDARLLAEIFPDRIRKALELNEFKSLL